MAEAKEEKKIFKVKHKKWLGDGFEHTYNESQIKVIGGIAHCHTEQAAKVLVNIRGYDWLDPKDDAGSPENLIKKQKEAKVRENISKALTAVGSGIRKVGQAFKENKKAKSSKSKGTSKASDPKE